MSIQKKILFTHKTELKRSSSFRVLIYQKDDHSTCSLQEQRTRPSLLNCKEIISTPLTSFLAYSFSKKKKRVFLSNPIWAYSSSLSNHFLLVWIDKQSLIIQPCGWNDNCVKILFYKTYFNLSFFSWQNSSLIFRF